jgi:restriction endonuclease S subunit
MSHVAIAELGEIAEVLPGLSTGTRLEHNPDGSHQVLLSRHLKPGLPYRYADRDSFRITPERDAQKYEVRAGDILFMSRGTRNIASWIESVSAPTIAPVSFYIVRPRSMLDPGYLTWFLNQRRAQQTIADIRTGAGTPIVQRAPFGQLRVPIPDIETQRAIASISAAMAHETQTLAELAMTTTRLHELTSEQMARELYARAETRNAE